MKRLLLPVLAFACIGCVEGDGRSGGGVIVTHDGRFIANTDLNAKAETERAIVTSLAEPLGPTWQVRAQLQELPELHGDAQQGMPEWRWSTIHAQIVLAGTGTPALSPADIQTAVEKYLRRKLTPRAPGPLVVTVEVQPLAAAATSSAPATAPGPVPTASSPRSYTVQPGDTWADLSSAFYGGPEGWRALREANGGAERPIVGTVVVIPPRH